MMKEHDLPNRLVKGKSSQLRKVNVPKSGGKGGQIDTSWGDINWTPTKLRIVLTVLIAPVITAIIVSLNAGNFLISLVLTSLIIFVGVLYLAVRYIDRSEF